MLVSEYLLVVVDNTSVPIMVVLVIILASIQFLSNRYIIIIDNDNIAQLQLKCNSFIPPI